MMTDNLVNALGEYIRQEIIPNVQDSTTKVALGMFVNRMKKNPHMIDAIMERPIVKIMIGDVDDVESFIDCLKESVQTYGKIVLTVPKIPLLLPNEQKLVFTSDDIQKMKMYLHR